MDKIYVSGHQRPDTDSIAAAIGLAYLYNAQNRPAVPCCLGPLNKESRWLLERCHLEAPKLVKDARKTLDEIELDEARTVKEDEMVLSVLKKMENTGRMSFAVVDGDGKMTGLLTSRDIGTIGLSDTAVGIDLLKQTPLLHMAMAVSGSLLVNPAIPHINGKVSMIAANIHGAENYDVQDRIVICGDDAQSQKRLIEKGAGALMLVWAQTVDEETRQLAKEHNCAIILSGHGAMNTSRYLYFSIPARLLCKRDVKSFRTTDLAQDVLERMKNDRFRSYPVLKEDGTVKGFVERWHLLQMKPRKVALVDHNEFAQSMRGIESAQVIQVVDHHRVAGFFTSTPVAMRCETVGSTSTIVAKMYHEQSILLPADIARLLLGAILSDTLAFSSPTTTQEDIFMAQSLAIIAKEDTQKMAKEMFAISTDVTGMDMDTLLQQDVKEFELPAGIFRVAQVLVWDRGWTEERQEKIEQALEHLSGQTGSTWVAAFTSIQDKGSHFFAGGPLAKRVPKGWQDDILSRKTQIIPWLSGI